MLGGGAHLDVRGVDRDASAALLGGLVDVLVGHVLGLALLGQHLRVGEHTVRRGPGPGPQGAGLTLVMAAVRVVLPWSTWPMVPMLMCALLRT